MADNADLIDFASYPALSYWTKVREPLFEVIATIVTAIPGDADHGLLADTRNEHHAALGDAVPGIRRDVERAAALSVTEWVTQVQGQTRQGSARRS